MSFSSTIQVLKVVIEDRKNSANGETFQVRKAECLLLGDDGQIEVAGGMPLSKDLAEGLKPGIYRAGFTMARQEFGKNRGDIVARLVSMVPAPAGRAPSANLTPAPALAKA